MKSDIFAYNYVNIFASISWKKNNKIPKYFWPNIFYMKNPMNFMPKNFTEKYARSFC